MPSPKSGPVMSAVETIAEIPSRTWTRHNLPAARVSVEAVLGLLATFFIGFTAPLVLLVAIILNRFSFFLGFVLAGLAVAASIFVARLASQSLEGQATAFRLGDPRPRLRDVHDDAPRLEIPLALAMVARLPRFPRLIRPLLGGWWLLHFAGAAALGHLAAVQTLHEVNNATLIFSITIAGVVHFAFLFAANLYLLLAVAVLFPWPKLWLTVWQQRFLIDLVIAVLMLTRI